MSYKIKIKEKDYPIEFGHALAVKRSQELNVLKNIINFDFLKANFGTLKTNFEPDFKIELPLILNFTSDETGVNDSNKIPFSNSNQNFKIVQNEKEKKDEIRFDSKKDINVFSNNFKKIVENEFDTIIKNSKDVNSKDVNIVRKQILSNIDKLSISSKKQFDKIKDKQKKLEKDIDSKVEKQFEKRFTKINNKIESLENNPNRTDKETKELNDLINSKFFLEIQKEDSKDKMKNFLNSRINVLKSELLKNSEEKIEKILSKQNKTNKNPISFDYLFKINETLGINILTNNIKKSDVLKVVNGLRNCGNYSQEDIDKNISEVLKNENIIAPIANFSFTIFNKWRNNNPNSLLDEKIIDDVKAKISDSLIGILQFKEEDKKITNKERNNALNQVLNREDFKNLSENILNRAISDFTKKDETQRNFQILQNENLRLKQEVEKIKSEQIKKHNKEGIELVFEVVEEKKVSKHKSKLDKLDSIRTDFKKEVVETFIEKQKRLKLEKDNEGLKPLLSEFNAYINNCRNDTKKGLLTILRDMEGVDNITLFENVEIVRGSKKEITDIKIKSGELEKDILNSSDYKEFQEKQEKENENENSKKHNRE